MHDRDPPPEPRAAAPPTGAPRRRRRRVLIALVAIVVALNGLAWRHARAMTTYAPAGPRTPRPEDLSLLQRASVLLGGVRLSRPELRRAPAEVGLVAETVRFTAADGLELEAWHVPAGVDARGSVILVPGWGSARDTLLDQAGELRRLGWHVLLLDLRGTGGSAGERCTLGISEALDVLAAAAYLARRDPRPPVLLGVSLGASAVLRAVAVHDLTPRGVILESCFADLRATTQARFRLMGLPGSPGAELLLFWGGLDLGLDPWSHAPRRYAARVRPPVLLLQGELDPTVPPAEAAALQAAFPGPTRRVDFPGAGHVSLLGADPARWRTEVAAFLDGL